MVKRRAVDSNSASRCILVLTTISSSGTMKGLPSAGKFRAVHFSYSRYFLELPVVNSKLNIVVVSISVFLFSTLLLKTITDLSWLIDISFRSLSYWNPMSHGSPRAAVRSILTPFLSKLFSETIPPLNPIQPLLPPRSMQIELLKLHCYWRSSRTGSFLRRLWSR